MSNTSPPKGRQTVKKKYLKGRETFVLYKKPIFCNKCSYPCYWAYQYNGKGYRRYLSVDLTENGYKRHKCELPLNKKPFTARTIIRKSSELDKRFKEVIADERQ